MCGRTAPARDRPIDDSFPAPSAPTRSEVVNHVFTATLAQWPRAKQRAEFAVVNAPRYVEWVIIISIEESIPPPCEFHRTLSIACTYWSSRKRCKCTPSVVCFRVISTEVAFVHRSSLRIPARRQRGIRSDLVRESFLDRISIKNKFKSYFQTRHIDFAAKQFGSVAKLRDKVF